MRLLDISKRIMLDNNIRKSLAVSYYNCNLKFHNLNIDKILNCIQNYIDENDSDYDIYEAYLAFLIESSTSLDKIEKNMIIKQSKVLLDRVNNLNINQKLIVFAGKIIEEAKGLNVILNPNTEDEIIEMRPSIRKKLLSYSITGYINIDPNLFNEVENIGSCEQMMKLLFIGFHELAHLKQLVYLNNHEIDSKYKLRCLKEFAIIYTESSRSFYEKYHDSFEVERQADRYAYKKVIEIIQKLNISYNEKENLSNIIKNIYLKYASLSRLDDQVIDSYFEKTVNTKSTEIKDLSSYIPKLKKYV